MDELLDYNCRIILEDNLFESLDRNYRITLEDKPFEDDEILAVLLLLYVLSSFKKS